MRFEDLTRAHWIVIAILLGAAMAWLLSSATGTANLTPTRSQVAMEQLLYRSPMRGSDGKEFPWIQNIKIYPSIDASGAFRGEKDITFRKAAVTYDVLEPAGQNSWRYVSAVSLVDEPYRPNNGRATDPTLTVQKYLAAMAVDRPWLKSAAGYAWYSEPRWMYVLWIGGCVLVLGFVWPSVQEKMIGAGYGTRSSELPVKKDSFWKKVFARQPKPSSEGMVSSKQKSMTLSQEELDRIAQMEAGLKDFIKPSGDQELGGEVDETKPPEIRTLNAEPIDAPAPVEQPKEDKDYGGEFYPTVAHGKKKPDNKP